MSGGFDIKGINSGGSGIGNIVEDTTPQLGGDLDLNGNAIDFPSTANISDVLDEDAMGSDSATALATQQSIKAYVDNKSASGAETTTGTETAKYVTPDGLAGSNYGKRILSIAIVESDTAVTVANGTVGIPITAELNGWNIVGVQANTYTQGVTGTTDIQIRRQRGAADTDVLATKVTIGAEYYVADGVINTSNDDLATGDMLFVDVDAIHSGTAPNGLSVAIIVQLP